MKDIDIKKDLHLSALAMGYRITSQYTMKKPVGNTCYIIDLSRNSFSCWFYSVVGEALCWSYNTFEKDPEEGYIHIIRNMEKEHGIVKFETYDSNGKAFEFLTQEQEFEWMLS